MSARIQYLLVPFALAGLLVFATLSSAANAADAAQQNGPSLAAAESNRAADSPPDRSPTSLHAPSGGDAALGALEQSRLSSPQATFRTFLEAARAARYGDAAKCLELSANEQARAAELAERLKQVIDRLGTFDLKSIPDDGAAEKPYVLAWQGRPKANAEERKDRLTISRGVDGAWRFSAPTVTSIDELWQLWAKPVAAAAASATPDTASAAKIRALFPTALWQTRFLLPDYQWICLGAILALGLMADRAVRSIARSVTATLLRCFDAHGDSAPEDEAARQNLWKPVGMLAQAWVWYGGTRMIGLPEEIQAIFFTAIKLFAVVAGVWTSFRCVDLFSRYLTRKAAATQTRFDDLLIPLIAKSLKVLVTCVSLIMGAEAFNLPVTGLIGGLGLGGAALALASKDALGNLFGSLSVLVDRPFEVGDWVIVEGTEGLVEAVSFRSTRLRTFHNSVVSIPNSRLTTAVLDNMGRRRYRRIKMNLPIAYGTPSERLEAFCEGIRELIRRQPYTRKDWYHVYFHQFSERALDVFLECFLDCNDFAIELRERHRLLVEVLQLADRLRVSFVASPKSTDDAANENPSTLPFDPRVTGQREAARIAGPLPTADRRPGPVTFGPPSQVEAA